MRQLRSHPNRSNTSPSPHTTDVVDDPTADQDPIADQEPIADQASPVVSQRTDSPTQPDQSCPNSETDAAQSSDPHGTVTTLTIPTPIIDTRLLLVGVTKKTLVHSFT